MLHPQRTHHHIPCGVCVPHCQSSSYPSFSILKICSVTPRVRYSRVGPWPCACPENPSIDQPDKPKLGRVEAFLRSLVWAVSLGPLRCQLTTPQEPNGVTTRMMLDQMSNTILMIPDHCVLGASSPSSTSNLRGRIAIVVQCQALNSTRYSRSPLDSVAVSSQIIN